MIVKNEEENLPRCLESVKGVVDEIIVVDTGSSDRSKQIALSHGATVLDFEWKDDFSLARNYGIEHARGKWILVLDADEALDPQTAQRLRQELLETKADALILLRIDYFSDQLFCNYDLAALLRVFRNHPLYRYERPYHEEIDKAIERNGGIIESRYDLVILHYGLQSRKVQGEELRAERAIRVLSQAVEETPTDPNLMIFLGSEYYNLGDFESAGYWVERGIQTSHLANAKPIYLGVLQMGYNILGYVSLTYRQDAQAAHACAEAALELDELFRKQQIHHSEFTRRHALFLKASSQAEMAFQKALDGNTSEAYKNSLEAKHLLQELQSQSDQPTESIERLSRLVVQLDRLCEFLRSQT